MKLTWLGHACFLVEQGGYRILLDPYTGVEGYPSLLETASRAADWEQRARWEAKGGYTVTRKVRMTIVREGGEHQEFRLPVHKILCSHGHFDHNAVDQAEVVGVQIQGRASTGSGTHRARGAVADCAASNRVTGDSEAQDEEDSGRDLASPPFSMVPWTLASFQRRR